MKRNKKGWLILGIFILLFTITLGYAYLNTTLKIDGTVNVSSANWNVYWNNIVLGSNNVTTVTTPATISSNKTEVVFNVNFSMPGDTYEFTVDAVNDGTIDAMIDIVTTGVYAANGITEKEMPDYLDFIVTYSDDVEIVKNHILAAGTSETYKVRVHYKEDIDATQLPSTNENYMFKFGVDYVQKSSSGISKPSPFSYTISDTNNNIGQALPNVTEYENYTDAVTDFGQNFFLRHRLSNNVISESYAGFVLNNQDYYLRGAGATYNNQENYYNADSLYYETNKATLLSAFGSDNCEIDLLCVGNCQYTQCYLSGLSAITDSNGFVSVGNEEFACSVYASGSSSCDISMA